MNINISSAKIKWRGALKDRIKQIRTHFGLSQKQFASRIGRTKGYISNVENGHAGMSALTIASVCSAFGIREEWLKNGRGEMFLPEHEVEKINMESIASRVREVRKQAGLTQTEFGSRIGYQKTQISCIERGKNKPSIRFLAAVGREYKVSVDWLRTGDADKMDPVDDRLIEWLRENPEIARELRLRAGLDC